MTLHTTQQQQWLDRRLNMEEGDKSSFTESVKKFCWKHRYKIGVGTAALAVLSGVALYYYYNNEDGSEQQGNGSQSSGTQQEETRTCKNQLSLSCDSPQENLVHEEKKGQDLQKKGQGERNNENENANNHRFIIAVDELYGFAMIYFLPNVRTRLKDLIDVTETIKRLKDLKNDHTDESRDMKVSLWNNIKISSFTNLLATIYSLSLVSILLHIQMHILVRDTLKITNSGMKDHNHEEDIFRALFEGSYSVFFSSGLERFVKMMKEIVIVQVSEWSVESQLNVEYYDVIDTIGTIRKEVESDTSKLLNMFMLPAPSPVCESELKPASTPSDQIVPSTNPTKNPMLQSLIDQTFTIVTSSVFQSAYEETLQSTFHHVLELLRIYAFNTPESSSTDEVTKNLPLASLLPKVKSITARLIPDDLGRNPQSLQHLKSMTNGPQVSALCSRIFLSPKEFLTNPSSPSIQQSSPTSRNSQLHSPLLQRNLQRDTHIDSPLPFPQKKSVVSPFPPLREVGDSAIQEG